MKKKILRWMVNYFIKNKLFYNTNNFKKGDLVKYNWKAFSEIESVIKKGNPVLLITNIKKYNDGTVTCFYTILGGKKQDSCDGFWLRKCYFWETKNI